MNHSINQEVFIITKKGIIIFSLTNKSIKNLFKGEYKYYSFSSIKILDKQHVIMGSDNGEIFIYNFLRSQMVNVIPEQVTAPILFLGTWFTNANSFPLFYGLIKSNMLICRNQFKDGPPLFELEVNANRLGHFLGGYISVVFNVGVLVYKKGLVLVSLFSKSEIAILYFQENNEGILRLFHYSISYTLISAVSVLNFQILSERINEFKLIFIGQKQTIKITDLFSCSSLRFDYSSKIFSIQSKSNLFLSLHSLPFEVPKFQKMDDKDPPAKLTQMGLCPTYFDRLVLTFDQGLALFDISEVLSSRKTLSSELMILNWPNKLIESIIKLKKEKQSLFFSESVRAKVKALIEEKVDQNKFENPKFTTLFIVNNQLMTNQIELLKENKQLSFGQIPKYYPLVQMLATNEFEGSL